MNMNDLQTLYDEALERRHRGEANPRRDYENAERYVMQNAPIVEVRLATESAATCRVG